MLGALGGYAAAMEPARTAIAEFVEPPDEAADETAPAGERLHDMTGEQRVFCRDRLRCGSDQRIIDYGDYRYDTRSGRPVKCFAVDLAVQSRYINVFVNTLADGEFLVR